MHSKLQTLLWLIAMSGLIFSGFRSGWSRFKLIWAGLALLPRLQKIRTAAMHGRLRDALQERPEILGALVWPYIDSRWGAAIRIDAIARHFAVLDGPRKLLDFPASESVELARLPGVDENLRLVLDKPGWFIREGQVVLNLFHQQRRLYSIAFSLGYSDGELACYVGAIQGVAGERILELYKDLTKQCHGMRPRDLLIETLKVCCASMGVKQILFVADRHRHHRAARYFGTDRAQGMTDYDPIWMDRGATERRDDYFVVPVARTFRPLDSIPSKKRSMYRKRFEMTDELFRTVAARMGGAAPA